MEITAEGPVPRLKALIERLRREAPPLARIDTLTARQVRPEGLEGFRIVDSVAARCETAIGADTAVCTECLAELFDPAGRRYRHAFITCTHCGPRYTIARTLPYDRARTSMGAFAMCPQCACEYADPGDRRFHAVPIACPHCGPRLRLVSPSGEELPGDPIASTLARLRARGIVAIRGSAAITSRATRAAPPRSRRCGGARTAKPSRSRSWPPTRNRLPS